jgi:nucleotide-binding universal stress UspA family protein
MEEAMKILVGYDGSSFAKKALTLAKDHAKTYDAKVEVVSSMMKLFLDSEEDLESGNC